MRPAVHELPKEQDRELSELKLQTMSLRIDALTAEQQKYATDYSSGT